MAKKVTKSKKVTKKTKATHCKTCGGGGYEEAGLVCVECDGKGKS